LELDLNIPLISLHSPCTKKSNVKKKTIEINKVIEATTLQNLSLFLQQSDPVIFATDLFIPVTKLNMILSSHFQMERGLI
jgi:hypothetical protein